MKSLFKNLLSFAVAFSPISLFAQVETTPINGVSAGPHIFAELRNASFDNTARTISADVYVSASAAYVTYVTANGASYGMQNVDLVFNVDLGSDGTDAAGTPIIPSAGTITGATGSIINSAAAIATVAGAPPSPYDLDFRISLVRLESNTPLTATPTFAARFTFTLPTGTNIGTVATGGAKYQLRSLAVNGANNGPGMSKWSDFNGNVGNYINSSTTTTQPLPVTLVSFNAYKKGETAAVPTWVVSNEKNMNKYVVERSADGKTFDVTVGEVKSKGNNEGNVTYEFVDAKPIIGDNYYRIKMVELNGRFEYSAAKKLVFGSNDNYRVYPNPSETFVNISGTKDGQTVKLINVIGQVVATKTAASDIVNFDMSAYAAGSYMIQVVENNEVKHAAKFIKK